jgi:hypothetical protein
MPSVDDIPVATCDTYLESLLTRQRETHLQMTWKYTMHTEAHEEAMFKRRQLELASGDFEIALGAEEHTAMVLHDSMDDLHNCSYKIFGEHYRLSFLSDEYQRTPLSYPAERAKLATLNGRVIDEDVDAVVGVDEVGLGIHLLDEDKPNELYGIGQRYTEHGMDTFIASHPQGASPFVASISYTFNGTVSSQSSNSGDESPSYNHIVESPSAPSEESDPEPDFTPFRHNSHTDIYYFRPPTPPRRATPVTQCEHCIALPTLPTTRELIDWTSDADDDVLHESLEYDAATAEAYALAAANTGW